MREATRAAENTSIYERLTVSMGKLVTSHPGKIILTFLLVTALIIVPLKNLDTSTRMSDFSPESEFLDTDDTIREEFNTTRTILNILKAESGNVLDREGLLVLKGIENSIMSSEKLRPFLIDYDTAVLTIARPIEMMLLSQSNGTYGIADAPEPVLQMVIFQVLKDEKSSGLVSEGEGTEREYAVVLVYLNYNMLEPDDETVEIELLNVIDDSVPEGYSLTSFSAISHTMKEDTQESLRILLPIAAALVLLVLIVSLKRLIDVVIAVMGIISSIIISLGLFSLFDLRFSQMTFFAPILFMVLAIDYAIHIIRRYDENMEDGFNPSRSMHNAIRFMGISILLSALTTILAFASNGFSRIPAVSAFGIFLAIGIGVSFFVMIFFVPSLEREFHKEMSLKTPNPLL
ncbi:MAG: MMPL family transporter [Thermoplasmata archaeon]|nr:MMPL family transporter [Thermoplasmata archaeon]